MKNASGESNQLESHDENNMSRTFRDGIRKIDLIIVLKDDNNTRVEEHKIKYLINIVKLGLEIELEQGIMDGHKDLVFVKVHAPDMVLQEYGYLYGPTRLTTTNRLSNDREDTLKTSYDSQWINTVRKDYIQPLRYSNLDRSLIVYMIILHLPFGDRQNFIGIERLIHRDIVVDAFALHDGPYYLPEYQKTKNVNARQILFYNWYSWNIFKQQPLNLVNEYFGPKIAFFFTYYGCYNRALIVPAIGGLINLLLAALLNKRYTSLIKPICNDPSNITFCTYCHGWKKTNTSIFNCPITKVSDYCPTYALNILLDNHFTPYFSILLVLWGIIFASFWGGKNKYLNWMWQVRDTDLKPLRPEYDLDRIKVQDSKITGITVHKKPFIDKIKMIGIYIVFILWSMLFCAIFLKIRSLLLGVTAIHKNYIKRDLIILPITASIFAIDVLFFDDIAKIIIRYLVDTENHRSYQSYYRSLAAKFCWIIILPSFFLLIYFGFEIEYFRLRFGVHAVDSILVVKSCGLTSCLYKLGLAFTVIILLPFSIIRQMTLFSRITDYNQAAKIVENVPCWEREYQLQPFLEDTLINRMKILVCQFAFITMFGISSPAAMIFVLCLNIYDFRRSSRRILLSCRRPLLIRDKGFDIWSKILKTVIYLAILVNVVTLMCNSNFLPIFLNENRKSVENTLNGYIDLLFHLISVAATRTEYQNLCYAHAYFSDDGTQEDPKMLEQQTTADELRTYQYFYVFMFQHIMMSIFIIAQYIFTNNDYLKEALKEENRTLDIKDSSPSQAEE